MNYWYMQKQNGSQKYMLSKNYQTHKYIVFGIKLFHLYEVKEQVKLMYGKAEIVKLLPEGRRRGKK